MPANEWATTTSFPAFADRIDHDVGVVPGERLGENGAQC
jgi:hypothetical protein